MFGEILFKEPCLFCSLLQTSTRKLFYSQLISTILEIKKNPLWLHHFNITDPERLA